MGKIGPAVRVALFPTAARPVPQNGVQNLFQLLRAVQGDGTGNLVTDGALATEEYGWLVSPEHGRISRSDAAASRGTHSLKYETERGVLFLGPGVHPRQEGMHPEASAKSKTTASSRINRNNVKVAILMQPACRFRRFSVRARLASPLIAACVFLAAMGLSTAGEDEAPFREIKRGQASLICSPGKGRTLRRPRGRMVDSKPSLRTVDSTHPSSPHARPR